MKKRFCLLLIVVFTASNLIAVRPAHSSTTKPSVPEFSLNYVAQYYDVSTTYGRIDIIIKNQPFASTINGTTYQLYYNIRQKGHLEDSWTERSWTRDGPGSLVPQSNNSQYTIISIPEQSYLINAQIDFQVQALLGSYFTSEPANKGSLIPDYYHREFAIPASLESGWSNTQTITIPASSITKPSIPEFTVKLVAHPYDVPTTYSVDPYTGENITHPGYHVENKSIEITINNQPFATYTDVEGNHINLYYNVRVKGYFEENWTELFSASGAYPSAGSYPEQDYGSQYTVVFYPRVVPSNGQMDFQVEALVGYFTKVWLGSTSQYRNVFTGESSDWSNTQTINISASAPSSSILLIALIGAVIAVVAVVCIGLVVYFKKHKNSTNGNSA